MPGTTEDNCVTDEAIRIAKRVDASFTTHKKKNKRKRGRSRESGKEAEATTPTTPQSSSRKKGKNLTTLVQLPSDNVKNEIEYPYPVDGDDHCETPSEAYALIAPFLDYLAERLHRSRDDLRIYDPYFCEGTMKTEMSKLGFDNVYNRMEDFYAKIASNSLPEYDVLVTNPPYSGDHFRRICEFCRASDKPYFLLLPNFVYIKDYYTSLFASCNLRKAQFFVVPTKRLAYLTPKGRRQAKSGKYTAPFRSFWYCNLGAAYNTHLSINEVSKGFHSREDAVVVMNVANLPPEVLADSDPRKKKARNALKRAKHKEKKKKQTA